MSTKLTLTVDQRVIAAAKDYAVEKNRSLSSIVEEYLKSLTRTADKNRAELSKEVLKLKGSVKSLDKDVDYKKVLTDELIEKALSK